MTYGLEVSCCGGPTEGGRTAVTLRLDHSLCRWGHLAGFMWM
jgi:hypothetical protein